MSKDEGEQMDLIPGVTVNVHIVSCEFRSMPTKRLMIMMGPAGYTSEAEFIFQVLSQLSFEERANLISTEYKKVAQSEYPPLNLGNQDTEDGNPMYAWDPCSADDMHDPEYCPGCGTFLGGRLNPMCEHPSGCGGMRKLPIINEDELRGEEG